MAPQRAEVIGFGVAWIDAGLAWPRSSSKSSDWDSRDPPQGWSFAILSREMARGEGFLRLMGGPGFHHGGWSEYAESGGQHDGAGELRWHERAVLVWDSARRAGPAFRPLPGCGDELPHLPAKRDVLPSCQNRSLVARRAQAASSVFANR